MCKNYKSKLSVTVEPVQQEIAEDEVELVEPEAVAEVEEVVEEAVPETVEEAVPEPVTEAVQEPQNVEGPSQYQNKKWRRQKQ